MLTDQDIFNRYQTKKSEFEKQAEISLVGHSLFDMWSDMQNGTPNLAGKTVANLGLSGTSTRQYLDVITRQERIQHVGDNVFIFLGVNDIVKEPDYSPKQVLEWIGEIVTSLRKINPNAKFFLLEATPVNNITTTNNAVIKELNAYFEANIPADLTYVKTWEYFADEGGNLDLTLCHDGLHFTQAGYDRLEAILTKHL